MRNQIGSLLKPVQDWIAPFHKTDQQQEAARMLGRIGLGTFGVGGAAAALMLLRRKNERKIMDEDLAKADLKMPVYRSQDNDNRPKYGSMPGKVLGTGLGLLGLGGTAAGIAYSNSATDGNASSNPIARIFNSTTGVMPLGSHVRDVQQDLSDLTATMRGEHAKSFADVPWFLPGALGASMLGLGAGHSAVNAVTNYLAKRKLNRKLRETEQMFNDALQTEQESKSNGKRKSKLGAVLDEFLTSVEEHAPTIKEASLIELYLALMGTAGVGSYLAGFNHGYKNTDKDKRLSELNSLRKKQLAERHSNNQYITPDYRRTQDYRYYNDDDDNDEERRYSGYSGYKRADLAVEAVKALMRGSKGLWKGMGKAAPAVAQKFPTISKAIPAVGRSAKYHVKRQPVTTLATLGGLEGAGHLADHYGSSLGRWKPSSFIYNRFADDQPLTDAQGKPVWGTRRRFSANPDDYAERKWSWNPFSERGFGYRFRKEEKPRPAVIIGEKQPTIDELVRKSNPSITTRRKMNEQFYDYS